MAQLVAKVETAWSENNIALVLLLDVNGVFNQVSRAQLLKRMMQVGIASNLVRWVDSFLSNGQAMLVNDGRTGQTRSTQAGVPQGSSVSPVLFVRFVSAMFQWLEDRHVTLQASPFLTI